MRLGLLLAAIALPLVAGCVTGAKGSARRQCYDAGFTPKTPEFTNCWHEIARRDNAEVGSFLVGYAVGAAIADANKPRRVPAPLPSTDPPPPRQCIYWTPQGKRVVQAVYGVCPTHYGD